MKRLLQLNVTANWGSTGKIAEGIGKMAMLRGWESYIAYGRMMNPSESNLVKTTSTPEVYSHYARHRLLNGEGRGCKRSTRRLLSLIDEINPDIVQLHNIHDHWINYPLLFRYLRERGTTTVWTFHDCWPLTGSCTHFLTYDCDRLAYDCDNCPLGYQGFNSSKRLLQKRDAITSLGDKLTIVSVSKWLDSIVGQSGLKDMQRTIIYNGVDSDTFSPADSEKRQEENRRKTILGVASRWDAVKRLEDIVSLRQFLPEDIEIKLIGLSPKQLGRLPCGIKGMERIPGTQELADHYRQAAVTISTSKAETFGMTLAESMMCGTPCAAYRTAALPEIIVGSTGLTVEPGDVEGMAAAICEIIANPGKFNAEACRRHALENFDLQTQFGKYIDLYESLL